MLPESCVMQITAESLFERALEVAEEAGLRIEARRLGFEKFPTLCKAVALRGESGASRTLPRAARR
jgi:hypothetical protein